jgi:hypothetical protein
MRFSSISHSSASSSETSLEIIGQDIRDTDRCHALPLGHAGLVGCVTLGWSKTAGAVILGPVSTAPTELFQQFPCPSNRSGLNAICMLAQRIVVGLAGVQPEISK